jgi:hypothetical protein
VLGIFERLDGLFTGVSTRPYFSICASRTFSQNASSGIMVMPAISPYFAHGFGSSQR